jgi:TnsA endonuclease-like protein
MIEDKAYPEMPALCPKHEKRLKKCLESDEYLPFLRVYDITGATSSGNRALSQVTGRLCQFMSTLEYSYFLIADYCPRAVDIRENYPLDPEATWRIAHEHKLKHHRIEKGLVVPTLDFLITMLVNGKEVHIARDVKPARDLHDYDVLEKLEIARLYCIEKGIQYGIWTDESLNSILAGNLAEFRATLNYESFQIDEEQVEAAREYMEPRLDAVKCLSDLTYESDRKLGLDRGASLTATYHLIYTHRWYCDLTQQFDPAKEMGCPKITPREVGDAGVNSRAIA